MQHFRDGKGAVAAADGAPHAADDAAGDAELMPERIAQGRRHLPHSNGIAVAESNRGQPARRRIHFQQGQIRIRIAAQHFRRQFGIIGQNYRYRVIALHHMVIGNDMPGVIPHKTGAGGNGKEALGKAAGIRQIRHFLARRLVRPAHVAGNFDKDY